MLFRKHPKGKGRKGCSNELYFQSVALSAEKAALTISMHFYRKVKEVGAGVCELAKEKVTLRVRYPSGTPLSRILNDLPDYLDKEGGRSENGR